MAARAYSRRQLLVTATSVRCAGNSCRSTQSRFARGTPVIMIIVSSSASAGCFFRYFSAASFVPKTFQRFGISAVRLLFVFGADRNLSSRSLMRSSLASMLRRERKIELSDRPLRLSITVAYSRRQYLSAMPKTPTTPSAKKTEPKTR